MNFAKKKSTFPNFLGGILLVCYKGYLTRPNPVGKASVAICSVKKHKMPVLKLISLMSHIAKVILRVIMLRVRRCTKPEISQEQYGFVEDTGTRNAIFIVRTMRASYWSTTWPVPLFYWLCQSVWQSETRRPLWISTKSWYRWEGLKVVVAYWKVKTPCHGHGECIN